MEYKPVRKEEIEDYPAGMKSTRIRKVPAKCND
jgi:hypothetical protein